MMGRIQFWLMRHPRVARPLRVMGWLQLLSCIAVGTAPDAAASTNAVVLNWTGLRDSYGVPVGDFYLSLASLRDQLTQTGPDAAVYDPSTWFPWMLHGMMVLFDNLTAANILTAEIGGFVGIIALAMWVMRLTISTYWLTVLGELAHTITSAVIGVTTRWGLVALTVRPRTQWLLASPPISSRSAAPRCASSRVLRAVSGSSASGTSAWMAL